jgi:iron complex outermembrane recepter protein
MVVFWLIVWLEALKQLKIGKKKCKMFEFAFFYEFQRGFLEGFGVGAGVFYIGDRQGDLDNSFTLPSYTRTDAALFYQRNNWEASLNFQNLFDVDYIKSSETYREAIRPGNPFTVIGSVSVEF